MRTLNGSSGSFAYAIFPYLAATGSFFILGVIVTQLTKYEWFVLVIVIFSGAIFWSTARKTREQLSQAQRNHLILDEDQEHLDE